MELQPKCIDDTACTMQGVGLGGGEGGAAALGPAYLSATFALPAADRAWIIPLQVK